MLEMQFAKGIGRRWSDLFGARARRNSTLEPAGRDERGHRARLGLEDGLLDVAEILAVRLERHRPFAADDEALAVVQDEQARPRPGAANGGEHKPR